MRWVWIVSLSLGVGCHLIGGAGDLRFEDGTSGADGSAVGGGAVGGSANGGSAGQGGVGGAACVDCSGVCDVCDAGTCALRPAGSVCDSDGACDLSGACLHGGVVWQHLYGDEFDDAGVALAARNGAVFVGGYFTGNDFDAPGVTFGPNTLTTQGFIDAFAAKIDGASGDAVWGKAFSASAGTQQVMAMAITPAGDPIIGIEFAQSTSWAPLPLVVNNIPVNQNDFDLYAAKVHGASAVGDWAWASTADTSPNAQRIRAIAATDQLVALVGDGSDVVEWSPGMTQILPGTSMFAVALQADGTPVGVKTLTCQPTLARDAAFDGSGRLLVALSYLGSCASVAGSSIGAGAGSYVVRYDDPANLTAAMPTYFKYAATDQILDVRGMAMLPNDGFVLAGQHLGSHVLPGAIQLDNPGVTDNLFLFAADDMGSVQWAKSFVASNGVTVEDVAVDTAGNIVIAGTLPLGSTLDLGGGDLLLSAQTQNPFIAKFAADGTPLWAHQLATAGDDAGLALALDGDDIYFAGRATSQLEVGGDVHHGEGDIFVMKLAP